MNYDNFWKNVLGQEDWVNELVKWENAHPEYTPKTPRRIDTVPISELSQDPQTSCLNPVILHSYSSNSPMTFNRDQLVEDYIQQLIGGMDYKTMECMVYDTLKDNLSDYTDEQLITEVEEYNPELLEDVTP